MERLKKKEAENLKDSILKDADIKAKNKMDEANEKIAQHEREVRESLKEETVLYTILSILTHSNKEWNIYEENINLVNIIIRILKKSQNKKSRLYTKLFLLLMMRLINYLQEC